MERIKTLYIEDTFGRRNNIEIKVRSEKINTEEIKQRFISIILATGATITKRFRDRSITAYAAPNGNLEIITAINFQDERYMNRTCIEPAIIPPGQTTIQGEIYESPPVFATNAPNGTMYVFTRK